MNSKKTQAGCIQIDIRADTMVTDFKIPFRALSAISQDDSFDESHDKQSSEPPQIVLSFSLADSKRQGCNNLKLDDHGIELCLRRHQLGLPFNRSKALSLRVIRAAKDSDDNNDH